MAARSAESGRHISEATAARSPKTTVVQSAKSFGAKGSRSAITGRFVTGSTAKRHPDTTFTEDGA